MSFNDMEQNVMKDISGYLTTSQINKIINAAWKPRDRILILLLTTSGRRITEIIGRKRYTHINNTKGIKKNYKAVQGIRPIDIHEEEGSIAFNIIKKKVLMRKLIPVSPRCLREVKQYIYDKGIETDEEIFKINRFRAFQIIREIALRAGIEYVGNKKIHPHHFRHSLAIKLVKENFSIKQVQQQLAHSSLNMTSIYLQFNQTDQRKMIESVFSDND